MGDNNSGNSELRHYQLYQNRKANLERNERKECGCEKTKKYNVRNIKKIKLKD